VVTTERSPLHELDERVVRRLAALLRGGATGYAEARRAVQEELRANRPLMNTPGGYWVL